MREFEIIFANLFRHYMILSRRIIICYAVYIYIYVYMPLLSILISLNLNNILLTYRSYAHRIHLCILKFRYKWKIVERIFCPKYT